MCIRDSIYTETITNFIAQGYQIHTDSMGGTQGEIARVDLSNGLEIIRVFLETDSDWHGILGSYIILTVGRTHSHGSVSYTHLDVYKRQVYGSSSSRGGNTSTTVVRSLVLDRSSPA